MKLIVGIVLMVVVINGFAYFSLQYTSSLSEDIIDTLEIIREKVEKECWETVSDDLDRLEKQWEKADAWWTPLMDHREIDLLEQTLVRAIQNIEVKQKNEALVEIVLAKRMTRKIKEKEQPSIKNIF